MDRQTVYFGQLSRDTDFLLAQQNAMAGLCKLAGSMLGTGNIVCANFTCIPTSPATLNVNVTPGEIYQIENLEQSQWSSIPQDSAHSILKQGILADPATITITPPATIGFSQVYLIEVQYQDLDTGAVVLPYFNVVNPSIPFLGPANSGTAQNTIRKGRVAIQTKAGVAATTGTQTNPTVDAGWTGLFYVTVAFGQTTITTGNIALVTNAPFATQFAKPPFVPATLPSIPAGVQSGRWMFSNDTGGANALVATVDPVPTGYSAGMMVAVKVAATNTGATTINVNGLGIVQVRRANLSALQSGDINSGMVVLLIFDGTGFQVLNFEGFTANTTNIQNFTLTIPFAVDSSANVNAVVAPFSPAITSLIAGQFVEVKIVGTNTGPATLQANATAVTNILSTTGLVLAAGQLVDGMIAIFSFDGTSWQLLNPAVPSSAVQIAKRIAYVDNAAHATSSLAPNFVEAMRFPAYQPVRAGNMIFITVTLKMEALGSSSFSKTDVGGLFQYSIDGGSTWILTNFTTLEVDQQAVAQETLITTGTSGQIIVPPGQPSMIFRIVFARSSGATQSAFISDLTNVHVVEYTG